MRSLSCRVAFGRAIATRRIKNAYWFKYDREAFLHSIKRTRRELQRGNLRSTVSELLFVEMWRTKILTLDLSQRLGTIRIRLLASENRIYDEVLDAIERLMKRSKVTRKEKQS